MEKTTISPQKNIQASYDLPLDLAGAKEFGRQISIAAVEKGISDKQLKNISKQFSNEKDRFSIKFEFTGDKRRIIYNKKPIELYRIRAIRDFELENNNIIHAGDLGGWITKDTKIESYGRAWVGENAIAVSSEIQGNALVCGKAFIMNSRITNNAMIKDQARVRCTMPDKIQQIDGNTLIYGNARVTNSEVHGNTLIYGNTKVLDSYVKNSQLFGATQLNQSWVNDVKFKDTVCYNSTFENIILNKGLYLEMACALQQVLTTHGRGNLPGSAATLLSIAENLAHKVFKPITSTISKPGEIFNKVHNKITSQTQNESRSQSNTSINKGESYGI